MTVVQVNDAGVFQLASGAPFVPRGSNYIRLGQYGGGLYHNTFQVGVYDPGLAEAAFLAMRASGYNVVRVFIDPGDWSRSTGVNGSRPTVRLDGPYMDNVADYVRRAASHDIYVMPVLGGLPFNDWYLSRTLPADPQIVGWNGYYLHGPTVQARRGFVEDFVDALVARLGPAGLSNIFAWSLDNEAFYDASQLPFSSTTVSVSTADGLTYSMATAATRQQAADSNLVNCANVLAAAIRARDPRALVTIGMFSFLIVGHSGPGGLLPIPPAGTDPRFPPRPLILSLYSTLSFLDVHIYPFSVGWTLAADLASMEWAALDPRMPVLMGEFGAAKSLYADLTTAAFAMRDLQVASCPQRFSGWLFWTWDCAEQPEFWNVLDNGGSINGVLAPVARPNPCVP